MTKAEFLEILKDYLKKYLSEDEINDILRDYEEYFVDGVIEGKSDLEIISALGSPKAIANELILQIKNNDTNESKDKYKLNDKYNVFKLRVKEKYNDAKIYISEKLTPNIEKENHNKNRKYIQIILTLLSLILIIPASLVVMTLITLGIGLIGSLVLFLGTIPFAISFIKAVPEINMIYIFASIAFIGGQILAWQIYIFIISTLKKVVKKYMNWMKTRNIYINASKKKEKYDSEGKVSLVKKDLDYENEEGDGKYE